MASPLFYRGVSRLENELRAPRYPASAALPPSLARERDAASRVELDYKSFICNGAASAFPIWSCNCSRWARL